MKNFKNTGKAGVIFAIGEFLHHLVFVIGSDFVTSSTVQLPAQVSVLHSLDQGLVCSSHCNIETLKHTSLQCYYILLPSDKRTDGFHGHAGAMACHYMAHMNIKTRGWRTNSFVYAFSPVLFEAPVSDSRLPTFAQFFQGLCSVLHSLDQVLVSSSHSNIETLKQTSFQCTYIFLPSDNGLMLLRRWQDQRKSSQPWMSIS
ncbi:hypothetical protein POM88_051346 [Heracleum sosnowskyi]|uniref:Uncharacterized protein n=1 Tax=Heracleum sosnowskyi TaxID=360622 RepID=A0AAD8H1S1_9APIA|nr:hypothetical protein POM88_051346 [Heracleum sosnowskyi]